MLLRLERATRRRRAGLLLAETWEQRRLGASLQREGRMSVTCSTPRRESADASEGAGDVEGGAGGCERVARSISLPVSWLLFSQQRFEPLID